MGADGFQNALGYGVGTLAALESLRSPGGLGRFLTGEIAARENPNVRASLIGSPFSSGFLFTGGSRRPLDLGPGGTGPSAPQQVFQPNLPPLSPEELLKQQIAGASSEALTTATPEDYRQAGRYNIGLPTMGPIPPGMEPYSVGPSGTTYRKTPPAEPQLVKVPGAANTFYDPISGKYVKGGKEATPTQTGVYKNELEMFQKDRAAWEKYQTAKAVAGGEKAGESARARELVKLSTLTSTTKTMIETAPSVLGLSDRVRQDLQKAATGPAAGRWQEFYQTDLGASDPDFARLNTDLGLLQTALQRMHVGARGGDHMLAHFARLVGEGKQSPENLAASLEQIDAYANDKLAERAAAAQALQPGGPKGGPAGAPGARPPAGGGSLREQHPEYFTE